MSDDRSATPSWWQTIPGMLTGLAAVITAVTGLIVAFNHTGNRSEQVPPSSSSVSGGTSPALPAASPAPSRAPGAVPAAGRPQAIALPALNRVTLAGGAAVITILSAQVEPLDLDRRALKFVVRYTNAGRYPANFWSASYRLIVADVPRAPTNFLDEVVDGDSAKEGEVVFEVPMNVKDVVFQISSGDEKSRVPFKLP
jgi:hypothetical protein